MYKLYLITNILDNKKYVGQTKNIIEYRFNEHLNETLYDKKHCCILHNAIKKYGKDNFKLELLLDNIREEDIDMLEVLYIEKYNTYYKTGWGYNMTLGGQGIHGYRHTDATKVKISEASVSNWKVLKSNAEKLSNRSKKLSKSMSNRPKSESHRQKLSKVASERYDDKNPFYGKHHSDKTKKAISTANGLKVCMYDLSNGKMIKEFDSALQAVNYLIEMNITKNKTANTRILYVCHGRAKSAYGFGWRFI